MARKSGPLTDSAIRKAQPGQKLSDNIGERNKGRLVLVVTDTGRKTWHFRDQTTRGDRTRKLGEYPEMSLSEAREKGREFSARPDAMRRYGTFGDLLDAYVKSLEARNAASAKDTANELKRAIPEEDPIRKKEAREIITEDIAAILREKHDGGRVTTRVNRLRSLLSAAFNHARQHDYDPRKPSGAATFAVQHNPVAGTPRVAEWERTRDRVLTRAEMHAFYETMLAQSARLSAAAAEVRKTKGKATPLSQQHDQGAAIAALWCAVALTGQRVVQLLAAAEEEAELPGKGKAKPVKQRLLILTDSKGRGAKPKRHALPLTPRLIELWKTAQGARTADVFTVRGAGSTALKAIAPRATPMDIRRTVETALMDAGVSREDRAELLSHGRNGGVQQKHYERTDYVEPKLRALEVLERWVVEAAEAKPAAKRPRRAGKTAPGAATESGNRRTPTPRRPIT
jgi:hypothetical protein